MAHSTFYGLKKGHPTRWQKTVDVGTAKKPKKVVLVFEPGEFQELSEKEEKALRKYIDAGLLCSRESDKTRLLVGPEAGRAEDADRALVEENDSLRSQVAELQGKLDSAESALAELQGHLDEEASTADEQIQALVNQVKELGGEPVIELVDQEAAEDAGQSGEAGNTSEDQAAASAR